MGDEPPFLESLRTATDSEPYSVTFENPSARAVVDLEEVRDLGNLPLFDEPHVIGMGVVDRIRRIVG